MNATTGIERNSVERKLSNYMKYCARTRIIRGYSEYLKGKEQKYALLSYLVTPLILPPFMRDGRMFSNRGIAQAIPRALNEMGYRVDIVDYTNTRWLPERSYDLFIGHGGINFESLSSFLPSSAHKIYFSTGNYWHEHNLCLARRADEFFRRHGQMPVPYRTISESEEAANKRADGIICLGNKQAARAFASFKRVICINNGVFPTSWGGWEKKDLNSGRRHFLFFAGRGHLLKGLDIILEAFIGTDLHIHICQHLEHDFLSFYENQIKRAPNIHLHGFIKMRSSKFIKMATLCDWVISATCTEGQPGAILECMAYGLVPIIPNSANIDIDPEWGIELSDCQVATIRQAILSASKMSEDEVHRLAEATMKIVRSQYSAEIFRENFKKAIDRLLVEK